MKKQLFTVILILSLLVSWVVSIDIACENKDLLNALKIAENSLDELHAKTEELSNAVDNYRKERNRGNDWNEEAIPEYRR